MLKNTVMSCNNFKRQLLLLFIVVCHQLMFSLNYDDKKTVNHASNLNDDNYRFLNLNQDYVCHVSNPDFNQAPYGGNPAGWSASGSGWVSGGSFPSHQPFAEGVGMVYLERDNQNATLTYNTVINGVDEHAYIDVRMIIRENTGGIGSEAAVDFYFGGIRYARVQSFEYNPHDYSLITYYNGATGDKTQIRNGYLSGSPRHANYANSESFKIFLPATVPSSGQLSFEFVPNYLGNSSSNGDDINIYSVCLRTPHDYDGDGYNDLADLDDDNDGILDANECYFTPASNINSSMALSFSTQASTANLTTPPTTGYAGITDNSTPSQLSFSATAGREASGDTFTLTPTYGTLIETTVDISLDPNEVLNEITISQSATGVIGFDDGFHLEVDGVVLLSFDELDWDNPTIDNQYGGVDNNWYPWQNEGNPELYLTVDAIGNVTVELLVDRTDIAGRDNILPYVTPDALTVLGVPYRIGDPTNFTVGISFRNHESNIASVNPGAIGDMSLVATATFYEPCDTDGDGIQDYLDLDSDGDGCPDAIEGNGSYLNGSMISSGLNGGNTGAGYTGFYHQGIDDNLGNMVDTNGVPNTDGDINTDDSQGVGTSANIAINSCQQYVNFDGLDDYIQAPKSFSLNNWSEATIQFWAKAESAVQNSVGLVGQKGVLEINKRASLEYSINDSEGAKFHTKTAWLDDANTWQHITLVYKDGNIKVYYNGELEYEATSAGGNTLLSNLDTFNIGGHIKSGAISNHFHGWIDEVRVFNVALTQSQLQQIIYQEIENNAGNVRGTVIPKNVTDFDTGNPLSWSNLRLYYRMGTNFTADGRLLDYSGNNNHGTMYNIGTWQEETAPMPFETAQDGNWEDTTTWLHGDVWDTASGINFPNINTSNNANCAIVHIRHNVNLNYENFYDASFPIVNSKEGITQIGLIVDVGKTLTIAGDQYLKNLSYLELNGTIDLQGDAQLIQTINSDLASSATGKLLRRQEGNSSVYWYNYWSSPVGSTAISTLTDNNTASNNTNNTSFNLSMLKQPNGSNFEFTNAHHEVGKISTYWLYTFKNGITYYDWNPLTTTNPIEPGVGYTSKGTGVGSEQQYLFEGKPNNGTILVPVNDLGGSGSAPAISKTDYLLGNPYPSALDIHKFIDDNAGIIDGTLQLWQQWSGTSHILNEYNGGYAQVNKLGATRAYQFVGIEGATNGSQDGTKLPTRYLPIGQGFIVEIINHGNVEFNNSQRVFIKETDANGSYNNGSVFFRTDANAQTEFTQQNPTSETQENVMQKLRLEFNSVDGPETKRELLLGFSESTTNAFDYGYDGKNTEVYSDDLNLLMDDDNYTIQAYSAITEDKVIPLALDASGTYNYTIQLTNIENIPDDQEIYLKDNLTDAYHDLRSETPYEFLSEAGAFNNRLEIVFREESETLSQLDETIKDLNLYYAIGRKKVVVLNPKNTSLKQIDVVNMLGQSVYTISNMYDGRYNEYNLQNLNTGAYIITLTTSSNAILTKKIIVK